MRIVNGRSVSMWAHPLVRTEGHWFIFGLQKRKKAFVLCRIEGNNHFARLSRDDIMIYWKWIMAHWSNACPLHLRRDTCLSPVEINHFRPPLNLAISSQEPFFFIILFTPRLRSCQNTPCKPRPAEKSFLLCNRAYCTTAFAYILNTGSCGHVSYLVIFACGTNTTCSYSALPIFTTSFNACHFCSFLQQHTTCLSNIPTAFFQSNPWWHLVS